MLCKNPIFPVTYDFGNDTGKGMRRNQDLISDKFSIKVVEFFTGSGVLFSFFLFVCLLISKCRESRGSFFYVHGRQLLLQNFRHQLRQLWCEGPTKLVVICYFRLKEKKKKKKLNFDKLLFLEIVETLLPHFGLICFICSYHDSN